MTTCIGAQLYTLRDHTKTPTDLAHTCKRLRQMGYQAVQVSAVGPMPTEELARILRDEGLQCAATHVSMDMLRDTAKCVDYHGKLNCVYPAIGGFFPPQSTQEVFDQFIAEFATLAEQLAPHGLTIGYHNHSRELSTFGPRSPRILDHLITQLPAKVWFEIDTYWIAHGGGNPATWIRKVSGRIPCVHVKDMSINIAQEHQMCEVGSGNLHWSQILPACAQAGVKWYLVERDSGQLDPFESLKISLEYLHSLGLR